MQKLDQAPPSNASICLPNVKKSSDKFPALGLNPNVLAFVRLTTNEIKNIKIKQNTSCNLSVLEHQTLQNLSSNSTITIKPSDKGGNIVVLDNEQYIQMCMKILNNRIWYSPVTTTKIDKLEQECYQLVDAAFYHTLISKNEWEFIRTPFPRTQVLCITETAQEYVAPIISGNGTLTENLSKLMVTFALTF